VKIFGISMVRDEADIIGVTVLHHLSLGLDRIIVLDNGSTDGTDEVLRGLGKEDDRVRWTRDEGAFNQAAITTDLAREAYRQGADWVMPFDADEFWWAKRNDFREILTNSHAGALRVRPINFVQAREQHESTPEALLTMTRRSAETFPAGKLSRQLLESHQIASVQMAYPPKWVSRPTSDIEIGRGNHKVTGVRGEYASCNGIVCLHAMLRSRALLASKLERSHRLTEAGIIRGAGRVWHWARAIGEGKLDQEWAANSYEREHLDVYGKRHQVVFDPRLRRVVAPHVLRLSENPAAVRLALAQGTRRKPKPREH
jgi:glycosyltransferase involved in cell wall biosynthesis